MYKIDGVIKDYAWGGLEFIPHLLRQASSEKPAAELWFGDHPQGAALLDHCPLDQWIKEHGKAVLSQKSQQRFGLKLPFLLKILDVRLPLSIQLHPNKSQAEAGFAQEEAAGIARNAPERNYQDDNHKPEMMVALSEFWLLHGFAPLETIKAQLTARPSLLPIWQLIAQEGLDSAYQKIMTAKQTQLAEWLLPLLDLPAPDKTSADPDYWLHYTVKAMNIQREALDAGLLSFYLLNIVCLQKGEGIFQAARLPHAYLRGQNIEIMAASNNVLRAGLTPKHIDIPELLRIIETKNITPAIIKPQQQQWVTYPAPVEDFTLRTLTLENEKIEICAQELMIVLNLQEPITLMTPRQNLLLNSGEAALIPAGEKFSCQTEHKAYVVFASTVIA